MDIILFLFSSVDSHFDSLSDLFPYPFSPFSQGQASVLNLTSVHIPTPCYVSSQSRHVKDPGHSAGSMLQLNTPASYVHVASNKTVNWCMVVRCTQDLS